MNVILEIGITSFIIGSFLIFSAAKVMIKYHPKRTI